MSLSLITKGIVASTLSIATRGMLEKFIPGNQPNFTVLTIKDLLPGDTIKIKLKVKRGTTDGTFLKRPGETRESLNDTARRVLTARPAARVLANNIETRFLSIELQNVAMNGNFMQLTLSYDDLDKVSKLITGLTLSPLEEQLTRQNISVNDRLNGQFFPVNSRFMPVRITRG